MNTFLSAYVFVTKFSEKYHHIRPDLSFLEIEGENYNDLLELALQRTGIMFRDDY